MCVAVAGFVAFGACSGHPASTPGHPAPPPPEKRVRRLAPPRAIDPSIRGAAYLTAVSARLQPGWGQFLDDCRMRLPAEHPLNHLELVAVAQLAVEPSGGVSDLAITTSGNADFDRAIQDAIIDVAPLPAPPLELVSDDDRVHLAWTFARDDRQAGPASARVIAVELPLATVVERRVEQKDLARAAKRILESERDPAAEAATARVLVAVLREALGSADRDTQRAAIAAVARAHLTELAGAVRAFISATAELELRLAAVDAAAALDDQNAVAAIAAELPTDLADHEALALADTRALVRLGHAADAVAAIRAALPAPTALEALALAPDPALAEKLAGWGAHGSPRTRAAACAAFATGMWPQIARGLTDPDAQVRAACADAAAHAGTPTKLVLTRLHDLATDRDRAARAHAVAALISLDPEHTPAKDLVADKDADVRFAAITALDARGELSPDLATIASADTALAIRLVAIPRLTDTAVLSRLAADADSTVATAAAIRLGALRGRAASTRPALERVVSSTPGSAERVRAAVAWLLAR